MRKNKTKSNVNKGKTNKTKNKTIKKGQKKQTKQTKIFKGGNNPFSDVFGMWGTITYNLSNALSVFTITPPTPYMSRSASVSNPSPAKQFV
jgi:hypothetical protein